MTSEKPDLCSTQPCPAASTTSLAKTRGSATIAVGVDRHKHEHVARTLDHLGQIVGELAVPASLDGYEAFADWLNALGDPIRVGIEGTGSFGAGLCEFLLADGIDVVEVERPRRKDRRRGKSDGIDALIAARKVLAGDGLAIPRAGGNRQALAALLMVYRSTVAERVRVVNQLQSLHSPTLIALPGVGPVSAAQLLACDARRFRNEAAFARCNGTAPKPASSGQTTRHRLDRGGDRQANFALHTIALSRALHDPETRAYIECRKREGKTRREANRALKRHLSRQLYKTLITIPLTS